MESILNGLHIFSHIITLSHISSFTSSILSGRSAICTTVASVGILISKSLVLHFIFHFSSPQKSSRASEMNCSGLSTSTVPSPSALSIVVLSHIFNCLRGNVLFAKVSL